MWFYCRQWNCCMKFLLIIWTTKGVSSEGRHCLSELGIFNFFIHMKNFLRYKSQNLRCTKDKSPPASVYKMACCVLLESLIKQPWRRRQQKPHKFAYFKMKKQYFCALCTCIFHFLTFCRRSRSFYDVKWAVLQLCGRREHMMTNVQFCFLMSQALVPN